jgi:hypothetical protein
VEVDKASKLYFYLQMQQQYTNLMYFFLGCSGQRKLVP